MKEYVPTRPPIVRDDELRRVLEWLSRELRRIQEMGVTLNDFDAVAKWIDANQQVMKELDGMLRWVPDAQYDSRFSARGFNYFDKTADKWRPLTPLDFLLENFQVAGYGGIQLTNPWAIGTIDATWTTIDFDTETFTNPRAVIQSAANNSLTIQQYGVWMVCVTFVLEHNESNQGRRLQIRLWNATDGSQIGTTELIGVGRNQPVTNYSIALPVEMSQTVEGDELQVQISSPADSFSSASFPAFDFAVHFAGEYPLSGV